MTLHVGQGTTVGSMTIFPVWDSRTATGARRYDTGVEHLAVSECEDGPVVARLTGGNTGERPVLVLDGQLFEGGWQHRMATRSVLVPVAAAVAIDVVCVEQGRWNGSSVQGTRGRRAPSYVRGGYDGPGGGQSEVWRRVGSYGAGSPTGSVVAHLERDDGQARLALRAVRPMTGQSGVLIGVAGQPLLLEVFDHPDTLREQFESIIRAAGLDAFGMPALPTPGRRARRMVERLERTRLTEHVDEPTGVTAGQAHTELLDVGSLRHRGRTAHLRATHRRNPVLIGA